MPEGIRRSSGSFLARPLRGGFFIVPVALALTAPVQAQAQTSVLAVYAAAFDRFGHHEVVGLALTLGVLFRHPRILRAAGRALAWYQRTGLESLARRSGLMGLLPPSLRRVEPMAPAMASSFSNALIAPVEWRVTPDVLRFDVAQHNKTGRSFEIEIPRDWRPRAPRFAVAADVRCDGRYLGQITEAVVDIGNE